MSEEQPVPTGPPEDGPEKAPSAEDTPDAIPPPTATPAPVADAGPLEAEEGWETRFKYLFADFENFRKRTERERSQVAREGRARLVRQILPLLEAAQRAREVVQHLPPRDPVRQGIELMGREWEKFLQAERIVTVARPGAPFQAETMEAIAEAPANAAHPGGSVVEVVQQGYLLEDALLRPAKVVVAKSSRPTGSEGAPEMGGTANHPTAG